MKFLHYLSSIIFDLSSIIFDCFLSFMTCIVLGFILFLVMKIYDEYVKYFASIANKIKQTVKSNDDDFVVFNKNTKEIINLNSDYINKYTFFKNLKSSISKKLPSNLYFNKNETINYPDKKIKVRLKNGEFCLLILTLKQKINNVNLHIKNFESDAATNKIVGEVLIKASGCNNRRHLLSVLNSEEFKKEVNSNIEVYGRSIEFISFSNETDESQLKVHQEQNLNEISDFTNLKLSKKRLELKSGLK